jgi:mono/diheme cytochrome c family protein
VNASGVAASHGTPERPADLVSESSEAIGAIHKSKCGACHMRVEPGSVPRATAESAMQRHRRRAKLTERQWEDMVDYLSSDHARPTAHNP